ncbi:MAG TPA: hypothetical protein VJN88_16635, partial [Ktedonobacterales bacterium]|nr:hypothetical protein [Ktedonobacterales bacterium]
MIALQQHGDVTQNLWQTLAHIGIRDAHDTQPVTRKDKVTFRVIFTLRVMYAAIHLDDEVSRMT